MTSVTEKLQNRFKLLAEGQHKQAEQLSGSGKEDLTAHNAEFDKSLNAFRSELNEAHTQLPNGKKLFTPDYEALAELGSKNGYKRHRQVMSGAADLS